jgi:hypothetical protein
MVAAAMVSAAIAASAIAASAITASVVAVAAASLVAVAPITTVRVMAAAAGRHGPDGRAEKPGADGDPRRRAGVDAALGVSAGLRRNICCRRDAHRERDADAQYSNHLGSP